jgi:hypothetical protein
VLSGWSCFFRRRSLADRSVFDNLEGHLAFVLVEPFLRSSKGITIGEGEMFLLPGKLLARSLAA